MRFSRFRELGARLAPQQLGCSVLLTTLAAALESQGSSGRFRANAAGRPLALGSIMMMRIGSKPLCNKKHFLASVLLWSAKLLFFTPKMTFF
jgi:hypothetical protein